MILEMTDLYVRSLFDQSRDGQITLGSDHERFDYDVFWEEEREEGLIRECVTLVAQLTELGDLFGRSLPQHRKLTPEQLDIWNTYLRPFPDHGLDQDALAALWEKESLNLFLNASERKLSRSYRSWYEAQCLTRLPWKGCSPMDLITRARRYARLVQLKAPLSVRAAEARHLAEEFLLYHCMVPVF